MIKYWYFFCFFIKVQVSCKFVIIACFCYKIEFQIIQLILLGNAKISKIKITCLFYSFVYKEIWIKVFWFFFLILNMPEMHELINIQELFVIDCILLCLSFSYIDSNACTWQSLFKKNQIHILITYIYLFFVINFK